MLSNKKIELLFPAIIFFYYLLSVLSPATGIKILWLGRGCQAGTAFMFKARRILWLCRSGDALSLQPGYVFPYVSANLPLTAEENLILTGRARSSFRALLMLSVRGFQSGFCQDLSVRGAGIQVGSPARCREPSWEVLAAPYGKSVANWAMSECSRLQSSLEPPRLHLSPYLGHLCCMIGTGLEKAAQDRPCGNPADGEGAAGERDEILWQGTSSPS